MTLFPLKKLSVSLEVNSHWTFAGLSLDFTSQISCYLDFVSENECTATAIRVEAQSHCLGSTGSGIDELGGE